VSEITSICIWPQGANVSQNNLITLAGDLHLIGLDMDQGGAAFHRTRWRSRYQSVYHDHAGRRGPARNARLRRGHRHAADGGAAWSSHPPRRRPCLHQDGAVLWLRSRLVIAQRAWRRQGGRRCDMVAIRREKKRMGQTLGDHWGKKMSYLQVDPYRTWSKVFRWRRALPLSMPPLQPVQAAATTRTWSIGCRYCVPRTRIIPDGVLTQPRDARGEASLPKFSIRPSAAFASRLNSASFTHALGVGHLGLPG